MSGQRDYGDECTCRDCEERQARERLADARAAYVRRMNEPDYARTIISSIEDFCRCR